MLFRRLTRPSRLNTSAPPLWTRPPSTSRSASAEIGQAAPRPGASACLPPLRARAPSRWPARPTPPDAPSPLRRSPPPPQICAKDATAPLSAFRLRLADRVLAAPAKDIKLANPSGSISDTCATGPGWWLRGPELGALSEAPKVGAARTPADGPLQSRRPGGACLRGGGATRSAAARGARAALRRAVRSRACSPLTLPCATAAPCLPTLPADERVRAV